MWWRFMQVHVSYRGSVIASLILYSDQTSLSNNGRVIGYPLIISVGNFAYKLHSRPEEHILLTVLPMISIVDIPSH